MAQAKYVRDIVIAFTFHDPKLQESVRKLDQKLKSLARLPASKELLIYKCSNCRAQYRSFKIS